MLADAWGLAAALCVLAIAGLYLSARRPPALSAVLPLVLALPMLVAAIGTYRPDFGGGMLVFTGLGLGIGLGAAIELGAKDRPLRLVLVPVGLLALAIVLLAAAELRLSLRGRADLSAQFNLFAGIASAWAFGSFLRAVTPQGLEGLLAALMRRLPVSAQTARFLLLGLALAVAVVALARPGMGGFWAAAAVCGLAGRVIGPMRTQSQGVVPIGAAVAVAATCLGIAAGSVFVMVIGGFVAATLAGRSLFSGKSC